MPEPRRVIPARKRDVIPDDEDSLLLRSAETLGRVIGSLQRELQRTAERLSGSKPRAKRKAAEKSVPQMRARKQPVAKKVARKK